MKISARQLAELIHVVVLASEIGNGEVFKETSQSDWRTLLKEIRDQQSPELVEVGEMEGVKK